MADQIEVAVVTHAAGAHVGAYLNALAASESCGGVLLSDPDGRWEKDARRILGDKLIATHRDRQPVWDRQPGMALITMEALLAPPVIDAALEAGCHVFAEKPSCVRVADFEPLVRKADSRHRYLMLAFANRANPETVEARRVIAAGEIGEIYGLEMHLVADQTRLTRASYRQQWFAQKKRAGGGHLIWLGIHWLDLAMTITGMSIADVSGFTANVGGQPIDVEDSAVASLRFEGGALGTLTSGYYLDKGYHSHIKIWGSHGWLHLEPMQEQPLHWYSTRGTGKPSVRTWTGSTKPRGYTPFVGQAVRACAEMTDPPINSSDSLRALQTVFGIYHSAQTGRVFRIGGDRDDAEC